VTLPEIKRIEVLKGPSSSIYGFNAFDGVINIITKSPAEMRGTTLQFGGGEFGTISSAAIHAGTQDKFGYRLSIGHDQTQEWRNRNALAYRSDKFNVETEYALQGDSKFRLSGGFVDANRFDGPLGGAANLSSTIAQGYGKLAYESPNTFLHIWWNGNSSAANQLFPLLNNILSVTAPDGNPTSGFTTNTYNAIGQHTSLLKGDNRLTYGANYRYNTISSNSVQGLNQQENRLGFYLQDEWHATDTITVVGGARYDLDTFIHATISPRIALIYAPIPGHTFRAGISVGYRPPSVLEAHVQVLSTATLPLPPPFNVNTGPVQGSTNLNPEEIVSYEVGYQGWYLNHRLRVRTDLFFNHISNLIRTTSFGSTITFVNDNKQADIYGGEAGVEFLATEWLNVFANYAYQEVGQSFTGDALRAVPRFKWNVGLRGDWERWSGEAAVHHYGTATYPISGAFTAFAPFGVTVPNSRVGSYNLLSLRGGYRFWQQKTEAGYLREAELAISAFNALNDQHKENPIGDTIGSRVMGWLTVRF